MLANGQLSALVRIPSQTAQNASQCILSRKARHRASYLCEPLEGQINGSESLLVALPMDTEFYQANLPTLLRDNVIVGRRGVTVQVTSVHDHTRMIFVHPDQAAYARETGRALRHPVFQTG